MEDDRYGWRIDQPIITPKSPKFANPASRDLSDLIFVALFCIGIWFAVKWMLRCMFALIKPTFYLLTGLLLFYGLTTGDISRVTNTLQQILAVIVKVIEAVVAKIYTALTS